MREIDTTDQLTPSSHRTALAAWLVILACVSFVVVRNVRNSASDDDSLARSIRMKLFAQEAIAFNSLPPAVSQGINQRIPELIRLLERESQTPDERLRAAIITGYLAPRQGMEKLETLSSANNSVALTQDIATIRTVYTEGAEAVQAADRDRLLEHHGYFGTVALASGASGDATARKALENSARRILILLVLMVPVFLAFFAASIALLVLAVIYWRKGKIRPDYVPATSPEASYLEAFALYLVLFIAIGLTGRVMGLASLNWNWLAWLIIPAAILWTKKRSRESVDWRSELGWYSGRGWLKESAAGIAGYLASLPFIAIGAAVSFILMRVTGATPHGPITQYLHGSVLALYGIACIFAPVLEETMFRGILFRHLRARWSWPASAALISFLFAIIHPQGWAAVPVLGAIAMVLAALREWRGSIIAPMAAHAFNNFIAITMALVFLR